MDEELNVLHPLNCLLHFYSTFYRPILKKGLKEKTSNWIEVKPPSKNIIYSYIFIHLFYYML